MPASNIKHKTPTPSELLIITPQESPSTSLQNKSASKRGFTLLELLIVIGILAILSAVAILIINPAELLRRARDSQRIFDLGTLKKSIDMVLMENVSLGQCDGTKVYASIPSEIPLSSAALLPSGITFIQVSRDNLSRVNGTGWIPINFSSFSFGSSLSFLPIDPLNTHNISNPARSYFYTYACNPNRQYELNAKLESDFYGFKNRDGFPIDNPAQNDLPLKDGGDNGLYEVGSNLAILPIGGLCPAGMVWVPAPGKFCIDAYEATYATEAVKVDGTTCSSNCPVSTRNTNPWSHRSGWPSTPQSVGGANNDVIDYCANMGKVLPTDFEWWLAAAGTPDPHNTKPARIFSEEGSEPCMIWNNFFTDGIVERPQGSSRTTDGYTWGSETNPLIRTGTASQCRSIVGAFDMIGNLSEWTNNTATCNGATCTTDKGVLLPGQKNYINSINNEGIPLTTGGPSTQFNFDYFWTSITVDTYGFVRSGSWNSSEGAGRFALILYHPPGVSMATIGFRCLLR